MANSPIVRLPARLSTSPPALDTLHLPIPAPPSRPAAAPVRGAPPKRPRSRRARAPAPRNSRSPRRALMAPPAHASPSRRRDGPPQSIGGASVRGEAVHAPRADPRTAVRGSEGPRLVSAAPDISGCGVHTPSPLCALPTHPSSLPAQPYAPSKVRAANYTPHPPTRARTTPRRRASAPQLTPSTFAPFAPKQPPHNLLSRCLPTCLPPMLPSWRW